VLNRFSEAVQQTGIDVVPRVLIGGGDGKQGTGNVMEGLLAMLLSERLGVQVNPGAQRSPEADAMREQIRQSLKADK
jgi:hypothetical protein